MESVTRIERGEDHETSDEIRARFGQLVVAYFVRAIESLSDLPQGPELAVRQVWAERPALLPADGQSPLRGQPEH